MVSDHGAQSMFGGIQVNEWLMQQGYLSLIDSARPADPHARCQIDWANTAAWADGGYYCRVFLNVAGREPLGHRRPPITRSGAATS